MYFLKVTIIIIKCCAQSLGVGSWAVDVQWIYESGTDKWIKIQIWISPGKSQNLLGICATEITTTLRPICTSLIKERMDHLSISNITLFRVWRCRGYVHIQFREIDHLSPNFYIFTNMCTHSYALFKWTVIRACFCKHFLGAINQKNEAIFVAPLKLKKK